MDNEEKYLEIRDKLKGLEPVKASDDFVHKLHYKIVELESEKRHEHEKKFDEGRGGFLRNLFSNMQYPWLVPAVGFTVLIFFVFYITYLNKNASENKQQLLTTQKEEGTQQKEPGIQPDQTKGKEPAVTSEPNKTLSEKESSKDKNIASDLDEERIDKQHQTKKELTDRDENESYKEKLKTFVQPEVNGEIETDKPDKKELSRPEVKSETKDNESPVNTEQSGMVMEAPADTANTKMRFTKDGDTLRKKLIYKLDKIDKSSLEKLKDEVENH